jgi:hypothetical protein
MIFTTFLKGMDLKTGAAGNHRLRTIPPKKYMFRRRQREKIHSLSGSQPDFRTSHDSFF